MKRIALFFIIVLFSAGCNKSESTNTKRYPENSLSKGKYTFKYKHLMTLNYGSGDSIDTVEGHYLYVEGFTKEDINNDRFFYTLLLQLAYCYLDTVKTELPITSLRFYDSMTGFSPSKSLDDLGNTSEPFLEIGFDRKNPISLPLSISFGSSSSNNKMIDMPAALENFHKRGCKDTWAGNVPKFAPLE